MKLKTATLFAWPLLEPETTPTPSGPVRLRPRIPVAGPDELPDLASLVSVLVGFLRSLIHVLQMVAVTLYGFHDLFVGLGHDTYLAVLGGSPPVSEMMEPLTGPGVGPQFHPHADERRSHESC